FERLRQGAAVAAVADEELLRRYVRSRDEAAFEVLVWRHGEMVFAICRRIVRDTHLAEDAFQACFLTLARKAGAIGKGQSLAGWLHRVAYRIALRASAKAAKRPDALKADVADPKNETFDDTAAVVDEEVDRLPERYRQAIVLCHLQGHSLAEAAAALGCSPNTIATRLARGRALLSQRLLRRGIAVPVAAVPLPLCQTVL